LVLDHDPDRNAIGHVLALAGDLGPHGLQLGPRLPHLGQARDHREHDLQISIGRGAQQGA
jgi:hypothetical protein